MKRLFSLLSSICSFLTARRGSWGMIVCLLIVSFVPLSVFANDPGTIASVDSYINDWMILLQSVLKIIYIVMRPLMVIAGNALDNTFVYGEFINLDAPLFQLWLITRTFVNYALGVNVLFVIIKYFFTDPGGNTTSITDMLFNVVKVGIAVQFSRFLVGALIDISTILTYGIGGLPMTLIQQTSMGDLPIMGIKTTIDLGNSNKKTDLKTSFQYYYARGNKNYAPCEVYKGFIVGRRVNESAAANKNIVIEKNRCLYDFHSMVNIEGISYEGQAQNTPTEAMTTSEGSVPVADPGQKDPAQKEKTAAINNQAGQQAVDDFLAGKNVTTKGLVYTRFTDKIGEQTVPQDRSYFGKEDPNGKGNVKERDVFLAEQCPDRNVNNGGCGMFLKDLLEKSKGFVGPLVTLFMSLLNFSDLHQASVGGAAGGTNYALFIQFFLKAAVGLMLFIPLVAFCVVLIVRVIILWIVIAFSPVFILMSQKVFEGFDKIDVGGAGLGGMVSKLNVSSIIGLIFSPVIVVSALSLSLLFLQTLQISFNESNNTKIYESLNMSIKPGVAPGEDCFSVWGLFDICQDVGNFAGGGEIFLNLFSWLIMNIFGIAVVRGLLSVALKASTITEGLAKDVIEMGTGIAKNINFLPGMSANSILGGYNAAVGPNSVIEKKYIKDPEEAARRQGEFLVNDAIDSDAQESLIEQLNNGRNADEATTIAHQKAGGKGTKTFDTSSSNLQSIVSNSYDGQGDQLSDKGKEQLYNVYSPTAKKAFDELSSSDEATKTAAKETLKGLFDAIDGGLKEAAANAERGKRKAPTVSDISLKSQIFGLTPTEVGNVDALIQTAAATTEPKPSATLAQLITSSSLPAGTTDLTTLTTQTDRSKVIAEREKVTLNTADTKIYEDGLVAFLKKQKDTIKDESTAQSFIDFVNTHKFAVPDIATEKSRIGGILDAGSKHTDAALNAKLATIALTGSSKKITSKNGILSIE